MSHSISFGTDGWRAIIAQDFTFANVERVAYAVGQYVKETYTKGGKTLPVLIGYDTRFLADKFALRTAQTLMTIGVPAKLVKRDVPTPAIAWSVQLEPTAGALQLTASHNPPEYCGMKYIPDFAGPATNAITEKIFGYLNALPDGFEVNAYDVETFDAKEPYLKALDKMVDWQLISKSGLKVVCDTMYSTSREYLDAVLVKSGIAVKVLHNWRDPLFGGGMPEPKKEYLTELIATVSKEGFDVGLATDGDADRFAVIDDKGNYLSPNHLLALLMRHLVKNHKKTGAVVRTVATTHLIDRLAEIYGLEVVETPVGFKYIGEVMRQKDVLIGGEESGGVSVKGHIPEKDGILANCLLVEMLACERKPLSQIWQDLAKEAEINFVGRRRDLHLNSFTQKALMEELKAKPFDTIGGEKVQEVSRKDGLKFYMDKNNWILVRPSGTEPLIRLYFEGTSDQKVDALLNAFEKQVNEIVDRAGSAGKDANKIKTKV
jgi:phosphomannomutase